MKSILSIFILLFLTNIVHGAQEKYNEQDVQKVQWYTGATQEIRLNHEIDKSMISHVPIGKWTQLPDYILFKDEYRYRSTGSTSPENDNEEPTNNIFLTKSSLKEMKKSQDCLENIHEKIIDNIASMHLGIERKKYSRRTYDNNFDIIEDNEFDIIEAERRLEIFKNIFSINEINIHKRQREVADFERSMRAYLNLNVQ